MMIEKLQSVFHKTFEAFIAQETNNALSGVSERSLCGRWIRPLEDNAYYEGFDQTYVADVEYNRMQNGRVKTMLPQGMQAISIICDLILHSRGNIKECDNLIAIEMKKSHRPEHEKENDKNRLITLTKSSFNNIWSADGITLPEHVCGYKLGYYVELNIDKREFIIEEYIEGTLRKITNRHI